LLVTAVLAISTLLQFITAFMALRLLAVTRVRSAWLLIATALILMGTRRTVTLCDVLWGSRRTPLDETAELIALVISIVMLIGVHQIGATFRGMKQTEEALRESAVNFHSFFDSINDIVVVAAPDGRILHANQAARAKLHFTEAEFSRMHILDWHQPERREEAEAILASVIAGKTDLCELPLVTKEGTLIPVRTRAWLGKWSEQDCIFGISEDLSAEREAQQRFERLFRHNPCPMALTTIPEGRFVDVNHAFVQAIGFSVDEVQGKTPMELQLMVQPDRFDGARSELEIRGRIANIELQVRRKDGRYLDGLFSGEVIFDQRHKYLLTVMVDITEQKAQEAALRSSEGRNRAIVSAIPDLLFRFNRETRCLDCHASSPSGLLIPPEKTVGKRVREVLPPDLARATEEKIAEVLDGGGIQAYEYNLDMPSGERRYEARMVPYGSDEVLAIVRDVTENTRAERQRLEMERRIQQTQKLESLGVLAGGIAHDFNNLLMGILGYADLALDDLSPTSPARSSIEQIETASRRAAELCRQMLAYSGRSNFVIEPFNIGTLIEEMAHLLKTSISKKAVLNLRIEHGLPPIEGDATQIRQIIMNLVINASEAIGESSGFINISTGAVHCDAAILRDAHSGEDLKEGLYVVLDVADTGCGMDDQTLNRLFEPFFTTKFTGRGLGMSAVLGIVRGHRGALKVDSTPGKGTTFRVLLPAAQVPKCDGVDAQPSEVNERIQESLVLLVDDEETIRRLGRKMLERIGFRVLTAEDGREALRLYREQRQKIDLVILDLTMPHMDGEETLTALKQVDPKVRVLLASGYSNQELEARFAGEGLLGFLQKPYTMTVLKDHLFPLLKQFQA